MKKILALLFVGMAAAAVGFSGCNRESEADKPEVRDLKLEIDTGDSSDSSSTSGSTDETGS